MVTLLTILGSIIIFVAGYFVGNSALESFDEGIGSKIMSTIYGILWIFLVIFVISVITFGVYSCINYLL
jgi:divalent metal cation (Fe/Co/Zn/Cd) transporter